MKQQTLPKNAKLVSFDNKLNMISRIPLKEYIPLLENFVEKKNTQHTTIKEITNLTLVEH